MHPHRGHVVARAPHLAATVSAPTRDEAVVWADLVRMVHRQMRSLVGGGHRDLEDLAQVALERLVVALPRFEGRAELSTFTYRLCAHVAMDHWRGWRRWAKRFQFWTERAAELQRRLAGTIDDAGYRPIQVTCMYGYPDRDDQ